MNSDHAQHLKHVEQLIDHCSEAIRNRFAHKGPPTVRLKILRPLSRGPIRLLGTSGPVGDVIAMPEDRSYAIAAFPAYRALAFLQELRREWLT